MKRQSASQWSESFSSDEIQLIQSALVFTKNKNISVIIPCYNNPEYLRRTLTCIHTAKEQAAMDYDSLEILLLDNNSSESLQPLWKDFYGKLNELCHGGAETKILNVK